MVKVNKTETEQEFAILKSEKGNDRCFDCNKGGPTWISLRHAVFVCTECAAKHRAIGLRLKSVLLDTFTGEDFKRLKLGGNFLFDVGRFEEKYERLKGLPEKLDKAMMSASGRNTDVSCHTGEEKKPIVKPRYVPKFGKKIGDTSKVATIPTREDETVSVKSAAPVPRRELVINRKEYKITTTKESRMGFGASKIKKMEDGMG